MKKIISLFLIYSLISNSAFAFSLFKKKELKDSGQFIQEQIQEAKFRELPQQEPVVAKEEGKKKLFNFDKKKETVQQEDEVYIVEPDTK